MTELIPHIAMGATALFVGACLVYAGWIASK